MDAFITRISRAAAVGLGWAFVWVIFGVLGTGIFLDELDPPHIGGPLYSGFVCGTLFSAVGGFASGRRRLEDMSLAGAAALGVIFGAAVGVGWFVLGDNGRYSNGSALIVVGVSALAANLAARFRLLGPLTPGLAAVLAIIVSGFFAGSLQFFLTTDDRFERLIPFAAIVGLGGLSAVSAGASQFFARANRATRGIAAP